MAKKAFKLQIFFNDRIVRMHWKLVMSWNVFMTI